MLSSIKQLRDRNSVSYPYVLIWPLAALGHVMLKLAELLCNAGVKITFLNTEEFHERLIRHRSDVFSRCINLPGFQFKTITDRLPLNHPRISDKLHEYWSSLASVTPPLWRRCWLIPSPVNCMITDGFMSFAIDVAREVGISIFYFRTISACAFWAYYCIPQIIDAGELPIRGTRTHTLLFAFEFRIKSNTFDIFLLAAVFRLWILVIALNSKGFVSTKSI